MTSKYRVRCYETYIMDDSFGVSDLTGTWYCVDIEDTTKVIREHRDGSKLFDSYTAYRYKTQQDAELCATDLARFFGVKLEPTQLFDR